MGGRAKGGGVHDGAMEGRAMEVGWVHGRGPMLVRLPSPPGGVLKSTPFLSCSEMHFSVAWALVQSL